MFKCSRQIELQGFNPCLSLINYKITNYGLHK